MYTGRSPESGKDWRVIYWSHRHIGRSLCIVESELKRLVSAEHGRDSLGPDWRDVVPVLQLPIERKDPVQVQSQTTTVVHYNSELLQLKKNNRIKNV